MGNQRSALLVVIAILHCLGNTGCANGRSTPLAAPAKVKVTRVAYHGWPEAWAVRNDACELVVVPAVSRAMSFRLTDGANLLWEDPALAGKTFPADPRAWQNVGGEKLWPTQQEMFGRFTGNGPNWPPPWPWDGGASVAERIPNGVRLTLPHDPHFGAHAVREFVLDPALPLVHVRQWIEKTEGDPAPMCLWTVMQVNDPALAFLPTVGGKYQNMGHESAQIVAAPDKVTLGREEKDGLKVGVTAQELENGYVAALFTPSVDRAALLLVQSHKLVAGAAYPDKGLQAQLYTSPISFARYTEIELLSPLVTLKAGDRLRDDRVWQIVSLSDTSDPAKAAADAHRRALDILKQ